MNNMTILPIYSVIFLVEKVQKYIWIGLKENDNKIIFFFAKNTKNPEKTNIWNLKKLKAGLKCVCSTKK